MQITQVRSLGRYIMQSEKSRRRNDSDAEFVESEEHFFCIGNALCTVESSSAGSSNTILLKERCRNYTRYISSPAIQVKKTEGERGMEGFRH